MSFSACSSHEGFYNKAEKLDEKSKATQALKYSLKALSISKSKKQKKKSLFQVAGLCQRNLKDYKCAVDAYKELIHLASSTKEREEYQFRLADLYFLQFQDYENALTYFSEVVESCISSTLCLEAKIKISRSYYYKEEFLQAITEIQSFLGGYSVKNDKFEDKTRNQKKKGEDAAQNIKDTKSKSFLLAGLHPMEEKNILDKTKYIEASILLSQALIGLGKYNEATKSLEKALKIFPEEANAQRVPVLLSVAFQEIHDYKKAMAILKTYKKENRNPSALSFIDAQIDKMRELLELQPGGPTGKRRRR